VLNDLHQPEQHPSPDRHIALQSPHDALSDKMSLQVPPQQIHPLAASQGAPQLPQLSLSDAVSTHALPQEMPTLQTHFPALQ
jgi:hypothetical protein